VNWILEDAPRMARTMRRLDAADTEDSWKRIRQVLIRALISFPEAQCAVTRALEEEFAIRR